MKLKLTIFVFFSCALSFAQQGKVGINTDNPSATLDIVSKANTNATKAFRIGNSSSTELVTVRDNGQVGINQATPATDALVELNSLNKALLLTRVTNATDIATPVNGMLVYDITKNCIRGYENNAWSDCMSAGGSSSSPSPTFGTERTPCAGLADIKDLSLSNNSMRSYGYPMFISGDGVIYGGWAQDIYGMTGMGNTYAGDISSTYDYSSSDLYSAYPAANILKSLPNAKWKRIMGTNTAGTIMFGITEDGKMYSWGAPINSANWPISGTIGTSTNRTQAGTPREIVNPDGNQWKEFYCSSEYMYAVDHTGKWWSWGGRISAVYNAVSFAHSPTATQPYYLTPKAAAALVPAPKYDPNIEETFVAVQGNSAVSFVYIGSDNKVYTYGENVGTNGGALVTTPQQITLPAGVNPVKILPFRLSNFLILGDNGVIYRVGNGESTIPATGFTAAVLNTNSNTFKDFAIGYNGYAIHGVPKNGGNMVKLDYNYNYGVGFSGPTITTVSGTSRFNIVKLWSDNQENIIFKDGNTGNIYAYNIISTLQGSSWVNRAIGFSINGSNNNNTDPAGTNLNSTGPFKLINCLQ